MAGRILTLQRQARELGRLRTGYTDGKRPVRSDTWIVTSHSEPYIRAAAEAFGGTPEQWQPLGAGAPQWRVITEQVAIDAIMPPGDPLSQTNELWSGGGCQRRCDGITEQISDKPCVCLAQFGDQWHEQPKGKVCSATTRLNVILPDMPDVGIYRVETHSFWAANEIAATVDLIRTATRSEAAVPIRLRIEPRQRIANGQTKKFPVVVVELRGATAGQILGGVVPGITAGGQAALAAAERPAIEGSAAVATEELLQLAAGASTRDELLALWERAKAALLPPPQWAAVENALTTRAAEIGVVNGKADAAPVVPSTDPNALWTQILVSAPSGWSTGDLEVDFQKVTGVAAEDASAADMQRYIDAVVPA